MIGLMLLALAQEAPITLQPIQPVQRSRPSYDVVCDLRNLDFSKTYTLVLSQYGGNYVRAQGATFGGREPTFIKIARDDVGIFDDQPIEMTGSQITEWYADGPIELIAKNGRGGFTIYKTADKRAFVTSPTQIAVTLRGGRYVRGERPDAALKEFMLVGSCKVSWVEQKSMLSVTQRNGKNR